jgi:hypothetical protein
VAMKAVTRFAEFLASPYRQPWPVIQSLDMAMVQMISGSPQGFPR